MLRHSRHALRLLTRARRGPACTVAVGRNASQLAATPPLPSSTPPSPAPTSPLTSRTRLSDAELPLPPQVAPPPSPSPIILRKYQEECIQAVLSYLDAGHKRLGVSLATGAGKTVIFTHLIGRIPSAGDASQTLILAHRRELVEQAARHCALAYPDKHVDIEMGAVHASGAADITVASIQSITSGDRIKKFNPSRYKLVLVDEAHHIVSQTYLDVLDHFGLRHKADWTLVEAPALVGVSATLSRFDGKRLGAAIDHIVYHRDYIEMIQENWLIDVVFTTVEIKADLNSVNTGANGDFQTAALSRAINTDETNELVLRSWWSKAKDRTSTLIFCVDLSHVMNLTTMFRASGVDAQFVTGETPSRIRSARVEAFKNGEFPVLLNCGVFTEGTDIPNIDCVLLARPTKSRNLLIQMIGRGMRLHKSKKNCHVIDMVAALSTGVVSTPTLFGLDPAEIVESADTKTLRQLQKQKEAEKQSKQHATEGKQKTVARILPGTVTFTDYDSLHELIADNSGDQFIRKISPNAWVDIGDGKYVLSSNSGNYLMIEPAKTVESRYIAKYYWKLPVDKQLKSFFGKPRTIAEGESFEHIVHAADTYASDVFERMWIYKNQAWRRTPASQAQLDFVNKFRPEGEQLKPGDLTKGKAGDMITRIKHGVKGRFEKASVKKRNDKRTKERAESMHLQLQGHIQVGPTEP